ncbi:MAG: tetratricopeptide repeat protein [Tannerellaceae bacterium]|nr:tetratricopeptide repeat protein [Tannerellaceae bacterium]
MTIQEINKTYARITGSLDSRELKNAFDFLQTLISGSRQFSFQDKLNELQDTYRYMLQYRSEGVKDPMQETIYQNLLISAYEVSDQIRQAALTGDSPLSYYSRRRTLQLKHNVTFKKLYTQLYTHADVGDQVKYETELSLIFNKIWVSGFLTPEDSVSIRKIIEDEVLPYTAGCQVVSALMLGLQYSFDKEKLFILFDAATLSNDQIRVRALIGILLTLYRYKKRLTIYPAIEDRLALLAERPGFTNDLKTIILRFILSRETEKITRRLQEEIIPEMMKLGPKLNKKMNLSDFNPDQLGDEMNPEWQNMLADSSLEKKMMEFSELQQEGVDVMHSTFVHLKSFPFFRELSNWFLPFTPEHSLFGNRYSQDNTEKQILDSMTSASFMCNSDKYSLFFSMLQLPKQPRKMVMSQFDSQAAEMLQQNKEKLITKRGEFGIIAGQYIQDLYRFFKLYPMHPEFTDIFKSGLDFHNLDIIRPYISDEESLITIAEYYLRKNYFEDALVIYNQLTETNRENDTLFQKIGYCKQMTDDLQGALEAYLYADLLNPDSKWTIRKIAGCYRTLKQPEKALEYYRRYEELSPDNLSVQISIGHCYLELRNYTEALKYYFKVEYLDTNSHRAWRPIAWCSFLTGKYDQARNYYHKIVENNPNMQDLLNAGHTEWALQNVKGAINYYKKAIEIENGEFGKFREQFMQDIPDLLIAGIEETEVPLMMDLLRYSMEGNII